MGIAMKIKSAGDGINKKIYGLQQGQSLGGWGSRGRGVPLPWAGKFLNFRP